MRRAILLMALLAAGCSKQAPDRGTPEAMRDNAAPAPNASMSGPNAGPTALPGVALTYDYSFLVPAARIAEAQEQHAGQCEALGPSRCRITGLRYHVGEHNVSARLSLKLAPDIARQFGKQSIATIVKTGGMLSDSVIESTDAGVTVANADRATASVSDEQKDIERQLARPGLSSAERAQLVQRAQTLRDTQRQVAATRADAALLLVSTPMTFDYVSGTPDPRLNDSRLVAALRDGWDNVAAGVLVLLTLSITLIPWLVVLAIGLWIWRRFGGRMSRASGD
jgi:hypothetical protein